ncbi:hypothetical protein C7S18_00120 [Ahniella affigens]|uniref:Uncharacterized protein n=1 Tax=Ahniella affigens TaxID=2021234 RepID=A0A2P1PLH6_9GAMM|nr:hypothetical protein [Ahniella affigens]AVP95694.1 hypothetical protein C7S18_00120 [Ahniella affigens]
MKASLNIEQLDGLLAEACSKINCAAGDAAGVGAENDARFKRILADALVRVWNARAIIHGLRPDLKPQFALEAETDPASHEAYMHACILAHQLATDGNSVNAAEALIGFANSTTSSYFAAAAREKAASYSGEV